MIWRFFLPVVCNSAAAESVTSHRNADHSQTPNGTGNVLISMKKNENTVTQLFDEPL